MFSALLLSTVIASADPVWHTDYDAAGVQALRDKKDLFIHFRDNDRLDSAFQDADVKLRLAGYVCLRVSPSYEYAGKRLLEHGCMSDMMGRSGIAIISMRDQRGPTHQQVISAHPFVSSRYRWAPAYGLGELKIILDLPPTATLSQRSMIYALRVHPETPQSVYGEGHPAFMAHAERHSAVQASQQRQHHADLIGAIARISQEAGIPLGLPSEVVAESWGNFVGGENVLEAAFSCIDAWRQSSGHWGQVSRAHRYFGYDIARGANGTWYATGIFAD